MVTRCLHQECGGVDIVARIHTGVLLTIANNVSSSEVVPVERLVPGNNMMRNEPTLCYLCQVRGVVDYE